MADYAKIVVPGTPISKSNFKMVSKSGRFFLPRDSGSYNDRYANYEAAIALHSRNQNPGVVFTGALIAILKVFYKSEKRHPDTNNITKSIFDGVEKSGIIVNDAQITRLVIEEYFDKDNPRFELELYPEHLFAMDFRVLRRDEPLPEKNYDPPSNRKGELKKVREMGKPPKKESPASTGKICSVCQKPLAPGNYISGNGGTTLICKGCFAKLY